MPDTVQNALSGSSTSASPENLEESMRHLKIQDEDRHEDANGGPSLYPDRPGKPDCSFYMMTGLCTYGSNCKYNHPPITRQGTEHRDQLPQRDDQPECQFFLKTGTCKFGSNCKYHHPQDKHDARLLHYNILGLPIRKDEKSCPYYMRTGSCKFGVACKFNHPQPANIGTMYPLSGPSVYGYPGSSAPITLPYSVGGISPWSFPRASSMYSHRTPGFSAYMPFMPPAAQAAMPVQQGWNTYVGHMNIPSNGENASNHIPSSKQLAPLGSSVAVTFPERPDQPECQYYMRTGNCKYGSSCKYHHPKERNQVAACTMGPFGLPLRPGEPACTFYTTYGSCKYGAACKFDHPVLAVFPLQESPSVFPYQRGSGFTRTTGKDLPGKIMKIPDELMKSGRIGGWKADNNGSKNPSIQTSPSNTAAHSESSGNQSD
ncbi:zinc finger CCCH domain-containing protein 33-like isoform X1 [Canna indica]|uniref:Zinc finger CCCH domain-containing protein 33-like isoform X1 n=1 Tax=Canna indica TaxID=4628 RepID=A0AAQ3KU34_9LILI|nr:zinc finger CCCH domain-containing protein 33-like isoform X1 [Canna indica]